MRIRREGTYKGVVEMTYVQLKENVPMYYSYTRTVSLHYTTPTVTYKIPHKKEKLPSEVQAVHFGKTGGKSTISLSPSFELERPHQFLNF